MFEGAVTTALIFIVLELFWLIELTNGKGNKK